MFHHMTRWTGALLLPFAVTMLAESLPPAAPAAPDQYALWECLIMMLMGVVACTGLAPVGRYLAKQQARAAPP